MYQREVDVDMLNVVKSLLAKIDIGCLPITSLNDKGVAIRAYIKQGVAIRA